MKEGRNDGQVFQGLILSLGGAGGRWSKTDIGNERKLFKIHDGTYESQRFSIHEGYSYLGFYL